ncbi:head GIN domain-containing protein [Flavobacterium sp. SUN046]|uniref:head GIN domain-containing protein n=1 Tax=Flavobacterium sp. SUN046 TaxID=3002440 RepID=UPI002DB97E4A|nr:head GIN domain-containing protein [Flavobacterium sp. SUN046]MEC4049243.1 head GIN domain-containing protein [Flavobacterium sp. SUN046]
MKKIITLLSILIVLVSCEKPSECIESTGDLTTRTIDVTSFTRIKAYRGIAIVLKEGPVCAVKIESGQNLIDNVEVTQVDNQLILKDNTSCNWLREYGQTTVYITAPNIEEIYSKTDRDIRSDGVLNYPSLTIRSLDKNGDGEAGAGTGDFFLTLNNSTLFDIESNNISRFYLSGTCNYAVFNFWAGDGRIEAENLIAQKISVYHRGTNDMTVFPIQEITGTMVSTGNIILKNNPPLINVQQLYQGHIILN